MPIAFFVGALVLI